LPRLSATSTAFDLSQSVAIWYDASLTRTDLAGTRVLRDRAPIANAQVTVVGSLGMVGKITAGAAGERHRRGRAHRAHRWFGRATDHARAIGGSYPRW